MKCGECNLLMWDYKCWRNGKQRGDDKWDCQWTLAQQERWFAQACMRGDTYTAQPMAEHTRRRREKEGAA